jgi:hypothetical protein
MMAGMMIDGNSHNLGSFAVSRWFLANFTLNNKIPHLHKLGFRLCFDVSNGI